VDVVTLQLGIVSPIYCCDSVSGFEFMRLWFGIETAGFGFVMILVPKLLDSNL
jgi:hypothetical protein